MDEKQAFSDLLDLIRDRFENPNDTAVDFVTKFNALKRVVLDEDDDADDFSGQIIETVGGGEVPPV